MAAVSNAMAVPVMARDARQRAIFLATGQVSSSDPLVELLYALMRDRIAVGVLTQMVDRSLECSRSDPWTFTNGDLARWAKRLARRLRRR